MSWSWQCPGLSVRGDDTAQQQQNSDAHYKMANMHEVQWHAAVLWNTLKVPTGTQASRT
jgi:hypothetical protein